MVREVRNRTAFYGMLSSSLKTRFRGFGLSVWVKLFLQQGVFGRSTRHHAPVLPSLPSSCPPASPLGITQMGSTGV